MITDKERRLNLIWIDDDLHVEVASLHSRPVKPWQQLQFMQRLWSRLDDKQTLKFGATELPDRSGEVEITYWNAGKTEEQKVSPTDTDVLVLDLAFGHDTAGALELLRSILAEETHGVKRDGRRVESVVILSKTLDDAKLLRTIKGIDQEKRAVDLRWFDKSPEGYDAVARHIERLNVLRIMGHAHIPCWLINGVSFASMHDNHVLLTGPSGSGKDLLARSIHVGRWLERETDLSLSDIIRDGGLGNGNEAPVGYEVVNCSFFSDSEEVRAALFGRFMGVTAQGAADVGAVFRALGFTSWAEIYGWYMAEPRPLKWRRTATVFLDELHFLPPSAQGALLRFLQSQEVIPVGGQPIKIPDDVRVIAASSDPGIAEISKVKPLDAGSSAIVTSIAGHRIVPDLVYRLRSQCIDVEGVTGASAQNEVERIVRSKGHEWTANAQRSLAAEIGKDVGKKYFGHRRELSQRVEMANLFVEKKVELGLPWKEQVDEDVLARVSLRVRDPVDGPQFWSILDRMIEHLGGRPPTGDFSMEKYSTVLQGLERQFRPPPAPPADPGALAAEPGQFRTLLDQLIADCGGVIPKPDAHGQTKRAPYVKALGRVSDCLTNANSQVLEGIRRAWVFESKFGLGTYTKYQIWVAISNVAPRLELEEPARRPRPVSTITSEVKDG